MIDPGIWQSEQIASLTRDQRLLFIGMVSNADDEGRLKGSGRFLKMAIFPGDEDIASATAEGWRDAIANATDGNGQAPIRLYSVNDVEYIDLPNWKTYQKIDKPSPSHLPSFDEHSATVHRMIAEPSPIVPARAHAEEKERKGKSRRERVEGDARAADADAPPAVSKPRVLKPKREKTPGVNLAPLFDAFDAAGLPRPVILDMDARYAGELVGRYGASEVAECWQDIGDLGTQSAFADIYIQRRRSFKNIAADGTMAVWADWKRQGKPAISRKDRENGQDKRWTPPGGHRQPTAADWGEQISPTLAALPD